MQNKSKKYIYLGLSILCLLSLVTFTFAKNSKGQNTQGGKASMENRNMERGDKNMEPMINGNVLSISGTSISLESKAFSGRGASSTKSTTYTVDASSASIVKFVENTDSNKKFSTTTASISDISVGSNISLKGTVSGESIVAKEITLGHPGNMERGDRSASSTAPMKNIENNKQGFLSKAVAPIKNFFSNIFGKNKK